MNNILQNSIIENNIQTHCSFYFTFLMTTVLLNFDVCMDQLDFHIGWVNNNEGFVIVYNFFIATYFYKVQTNKGNNKRSLQ